MTWREKLVCPAAVAVLLAALLPATARAEHTRYWRQTDFSDFDKGTFQGVAVRSDGKLTLAPKFVAFADPNLAQLWALRLDSRGRLYAAGGPDAKVVRLDAAGKATTVFESSELAAQTIAFDAKDNLYVGTSPDGKVYKVTPDGQKSVFFEPKTKYIWALAVDSQGVLFVATGDQGQVFAVTPDGTGQPFYRSTERHARSLAFDAQERLLIGTEPDGLILRVEIVRQGAKGVPVAGASFAVYETEKAEVTSLLAAPDGNLYAASIGEKPRAAAGARFGISSPVVPPPATPTVSQTVVISQASSPASTGAAAPSFAAPAIAGGAEVVKIAPDGSPQTVWTSRDELVFAAGLSQPGKILLGTGNNGTLVELDGDGVFARVAKTASAQVMSLAMARDGQIFVATANPGKIFALGPGFESSGTFESEPFDAKIFSKWGHLTWWGENATADGQLAFYVRSGNTSNPRENWSPWAGPYKISGAEPVGCPPARFVQWKAVITSGSQQKAPSVSWVNLAYLPKNVAPVIDDIAVQAPGIRVTGFPAPVEGAAGPVSAPLRYPRSAGGGPAVTTMATEASARARMESPAQGFEQKGFQSVLWSAHDDNGDDLVFSIYYRGEGEQNWRPLKDGLTQRYYSWDASSMPDGAYYLKIVASDSPSNPADQALSSELESDRFEIANTPPRIENLRAAVAAGSVRATFDATSSSGTIAGARYSVDAGEWQIVLPAGQLSDAAKESYALNLTGLAAGEHTLAVQVSDGFDNAAAAKVTFVVPTAATR